MLRKLLVLAFATIVATPLPAQNQKPFRFDFGTAPTAEAYIQIDNQLLYTNETGYGWIQKPEHLRDRGTTNPLRRDFVYSTRHAEFRVDLPGGLYKVELTAGDAEFGDHVLAVRIDDETRELPIIRPAQSEYVTLNTVVRVDDGSIIFTFDSPRQNWVLNGIVIEPAAQPAQPTLTREVVKQLPNIQDRWQNVHEWDDPTAPLLKQFRANLEQFPKIDSTKLTRLDYLSLIQGNVDYFKQFQNDDGAIIDPFMHVEWQYSTPCFALAAATLVINSNRTDLIEPAAKALDWSTFTLSKRRAATAHEDFFSPQIAHAMPLLRPFVSEERYAHWENNIRSFDPSKVYRARCGHGNWNVVALSGEALFYLMGLRENPDYIETCLSGQGHFFNSPWGLYTEGPMPYDLFPRIWAADMLAAGYTGDRTDELGEVLRRGAITSLFMQSPMGELPAGGRSAHHQWNEAQQCLMYEIYAAHALAQGDTQMASVFKRAAHLALESMMRWQRPSGEMWILKNRVDPAHRHGYEGYSGHSQYNLLAMAMLSIAFEHAAHTEGIQELATPADVGGFVLKLPAPHNKIFANAGAMYIEIDYAADLTHNATGLIRVHKRGLYPALGPSDAVTAHTTETYPDSPQTTAAIGPAWQNENAEWIALAEFGGAKNQNRRPTVTLENISATPNRVSFDVAYEADFGGPEQIIEHYDVTPKRVELTLDTPGYDGPVGMQWPVFMNDGATHATIKQEPYAVSTTLYDSTQNFSVPGPNIIHLSEQLYPMRNGWVSIASAIFTDAQSARLTITPTNTESNQADVYDPNYIRNTMKNVFRYTVDHPNNSQNSGWERAAFYTGVMGAYHQTNDTEYLDQARKWATENEWKLADNRQGYWFADNQTIAQTYIELYLLEGGEEKIAHAREIVDQMIADPPPGREEWWWCDALYMAPPMMTRLAAATGEDKYNAIMNELWWDCRDFLYDPEYQLFYRDKNYFDKQTKNGYNVFWSRGNGWVMGGLARVLQYLPKDNPHHDDFVTIYREMAASIAAKQAADGLWRTSLLDYGEWPMPETSGTAFFTFSILWGINNGYLEREQYLPVAMQGWKGLNRYVHPDGKLGWVQTVAGSPGPVSPGNMREYAPGAFLLAGAEMLEFLQGEAHRE